MPTFAAPCTSRTRLSPTNIAAAGSTPSRSHAARNSSGAGFIAPTSSLVTNASTSAASPNASASACSTRAGSGHEFAATPVRRPRLRSDSSSARAAASTACAGRHASCSASTNASGSATPSSSRSSTYGRKPWASPSTSPRQRAVNSGSSRPSAARCPAATSSSSHSKPTSVLLQSKRTASSTAATLAPVARTLLWGSLVLAPIAVVADDGLHLGATPLFVLSAAALVPLAWLIGEATGHAAEHTGPGVGGFLNASFGNAPELIIAVLAVADGLPVVVRGTITGSVVSNLLLVLGAAMIAGGRARRGDRAAARTIRARLARLSEPPRARRGDDPDVARAARRVPVDHVRQPAHPSRRRTEGAAFRRVVAAALARRARLRDRGDGVRVGGARALAARLRRDRRSERVLHRDRHRRYRRQRRRARRRHPDRTPR